MADEKAKPITYSETNASEKFSKDYFSGRVGYFSELQKLRESKLESSDSLQSYLNIDPSAASLDRDYARQNLERMVGNEAGRLGEFTQKNFKDLSSLLSEKDGIVAAISTPALKQKGKASDNPDEEAKRKEKEDKYNKVVEKISKYQETARRIKEDPEKYFNERIEKLKVDKKSAYYKFLLQGKEELLKADSHISQIIAQKTIDKYGYKNYLNQNFAIAKGLEKISDEEKAAEKKVNDLELEIEMGDNAKAKVEAMKTFEKAEKELNEKYKDNISAREAVKQLTFGIMQGAAQAIEEEKAKKAAEEKAKEKKAA